MTSDEAGITNYELRITNGGGEPRELTPALRRWVGLLERGYSIRAVIARSSYRGTVWRPGLFNPEGVYVQRVRLDTAVKLERLGYIRMRGEDEQ